MSGRIPLRERGKAAKRQRAAGRWALLNNVVDILMRDMRPAELKTWLYMYRNERDGVVETSTRQIAHATGLSTRHAHKAVSDLRERGLVEPLHLSTSHGKPSRYQLHPPDR